MTGINVDKTAPVLSGSFASGWQKGDVTVDWTCTDALSKVAAAPADDVVNGEGSNLSSTATCTDKAGNSTTRDRHAASRSTAPPRTPGSAARRTPG